MDRSDLLETNGRIVNAVADYIKAGSPEARVIVVSNPLDTMVFLMSASLGFEKSRVVGMAGVLDSARMAFFIAEHNGGGIKDTRCMVLGGHGDSMVPVPQFSTVDGVSITAMLPESEIEAINTRTQHGGAEIVNLLKTGSAFYAPSAAAVAMAKSILRNEHRLLPCAAHLDGQYGLSGIYLGVPCVLGKNGVERVVELDLDDAGQAKLNASAAAIRADLETLVEKGLLAK
jgi:malate dehydrogenase